MTPSEPGAGSEFFVGYLKVPRRLLVFSLVAAAILVGGMFAIGILAAATQQTPGSGIAPIVPGSEFPGILIEGPYPHLRYLDARGDPATLLLAGGGKYGVTLPAEDVGRPLTLKGDLLERSGSRMLQTSLSLGPAALSPEEFRRLRNAPTRQLGSVTLDGEIVDAKCFLGIMRPGSGRVHRACAQLCIEGGVPPLLVTRDAAGEETHFLLASSSGGPIGTGVLPFVAEPVRVRGDLESRAGMFVLRIDPGKITRL